MSTMNDWLDMAKRDLDIDLEVDINELLDMTKVVAHNVARPVAPLAAFLVGYAAAQSGGGPGAVTAASRTATAAAERWAADRPEDADG